MLIIWFKRSASCQIEGCAANGTALTFNDVFQGGLKRSQMFISVQDEMPVEPLTMLVAVQIVDISGILDLVPAIGNPKPRFSKFQYQTQILGKTPNQSWEAIKVAPPLPRI
ncbi:hypothetical protein MTR67_013652 [Solanum verrucosum]|uniref:Uncharacterized protein n=1 Tax=Solanum verrucosum TaxID=315347 RepID=A0AAF0QCA7_SOLVR|nr:hypothetical protein MTR67_013652 [Solanum verrucosum]